MKIYLFFYVYRRLFKYTYHIESRILEIFANVKEYAMRLWWPMSSYCDSSFLEGLRKITKATAGPEHFECDEEVLL